jgi:hypothetical protein
VKQFVHAEADGPVPFHYPGKSLAEDLGREVRVIAGFVSGLGRSVREFVVGVGFAARMFINMLGASLGLLRARASLPTRSTSSATIRW